MKKNNYSWLKLLNKLLFQWFFVRLTKCQEEKINQFNLFSFDLNSFGEIVPRGSGKITKYTWYSIQYWILPLTGWKNKFVYLNKTPKYIRITKIHTTNE